MDKVELEFTDYKLNEAPKVSKDLWSKLDKKAVDKANKEILSQDSNVIAYPDIDTIDLLTVDGFNLAKKIIKTLGNCTENQVIENAEMYTGTYVFKGVPYQYFTAWPVEVIHTPHLNVAKGRRKDGTEEVTITV